MATPAVSREWAVTPTTLIDQVLPTIAKGGGRRRMYKRARSRMLQAYAAAGLPPLQIRTQSAGTTKPGDVSGLASGSIAMIRDTVGSGHGYAVTANPSAPTAGLMAVSGQFGRRRAGQRGLRFTMAHELGHLLGLGHSTDDQSSIMYDPPPGGAVSTAVLPSAADIAALIGPAVGLPDPGDPGYVATPQAQLTMIRQLRQKRKRKR